jgi:hypothetical protein
LFALSNSLIKITLTQKITEKREVLNMNTNMNMNITQNDMPDLVKNI